MLKLLALMIFGVSLLDLPSEYVKQGKYKLALKVYEDIYKTADDTLTKLGALYEIGNLYLNYWHDTTGAVFYYNRLYSHYLPDTLAYKTCSLLINLDPAHGSKYILRLARLYPYLKEREKKLKAFGKWLLLHGDTVSFIKILQILASDYNKGYKRELIKFRSRFENSVQAKLISGPELRDGFEIFYRYSLSPKEGLKRRLLKFLYEAGYYEKCFNMVKWREKDSIFLRYKLLCGLKLRKLPTARTYQKLIDTFTYYRIITHSSDPFTLFALSYSINSSYLDTLLFEYAMKFEAQGNYRLASMFANRVKFYYPFERLKLWKQVVGLHKISPLKILLNQEFTRFETVKKLYENGYYQVVVYYVNSLKKPSAKILAYLLRSYYMLWKMYGKRFYLRKAFDLLSRKGVIRYVDRATYFGIIAAYSPVSFKPSLYPLSMLSDSEIMDLYRIFKARKQEKNIVSILKDQNPKLSNFFYYYLHNKIDSLALFLPSGLYLPLLLEIKPDSLNDSVKFYNILLKYRPFRLTSTGYRHLKTLIKYGYALEDTQNISALLDTYKIWFGVDRFYSYYKALTEFRAGNYKKAYFFASLYNERKFKVIKAWCLLKLDKLTAISSLPLDTYGRNLLYLHTGMIEKVNPEVMDKYDILLLLKEIYESGMWDVKKQKQIFRKILRKNLVDSLLVYAYYKLVISELDTDTLSFPYDTCLYNYLLAKRYLTQQDYDSAFKLLISYKCPRKDSIYYKIQFMLGTLSFIKKRYREALKYYLTASEFDNLKPMALYNAYICAKRSNETEKAILYLRQYLKSCIVCDKAPDGVISLGFLYLELGKRDSALMWLLSGEGFLKPEQEAELKYWVGETYLQDTLYPEALGYFLRVYKFHRRNGDWGDTGGLNAARLYYLLGFKNRAIKVYKDIIKRRKNDALAEEAKRELEAIK